MSLGYRVMYAVGATPWDGHDTPLELLQLVEGDDAVPAGRALDLGCGTGADAVHLAQRGWKVTAVDDVAKALRAARRRSEAGNVDVEWVHGSVAALGELGLTGPYDLAYDVGCFHGLPAGDRAAYVEGVTALTEPGATLLLFAFVRGRRGPAPRGADGAEITARFGHDWTLVDSHRDTVAQLSGPLRNADPHWYRLQRR